MADGGVIAEGKLEDIRGDQALEERFVELVGGNQNPVGLSWLLA